MKKYYFISTIFFLCLLAFGMRSFAESIPPNVFFAVPPNVKVGDTFGIWLDADTQGEVINSVNLSFKYDTSLMSFTGYKDDNAVVKLWVNTPKDTNGTVSLSGIIPGGVSGVYDARKNSLSPIPLTELLFIAKNSGTANFSFTQAQILKHDGKGTELVVEEKDSSLTVAPVSGLVGALGQKGNDFDKNPPAPFTITFVASSFFSRTPSMVIFQATDADSGIQKYQIQVGVGGSWKDAQSPTPLARGIFPRNVSVRAFDFYGNVQDANVVIPGILPTRWLIIISAILLLSGILAFKLLKYRS